jgi:hypothetical protein
VAELTESVQHDLEPRQRGIVAYELACELPL